VGHWELKAAGMPVWFSVGSCEVRHVLLLQNFGHFKAEVQFRPTFFTIPQVSDGCFLDSSFCFCEGLLPSSVACRYCKNSDSVYSLFWASMNY